MTEIQNFLISIIDLGLMMNDFTSSTFKDLREICRQIAGKADSEDGNAESKDDLLHMSHILIHKMRMNLNKWEDRVYKTEKDLDKKEENQALISAGKKKKCLGSRENKKADLGKLEKNTNGSKNQVSSNEEAKSLIETLKSNGFLQFLNQDHLQNISKLIENSHQENKKLLEFLQANIPDSQASTDLKQKQNNSSLSSDGGSNVSDNTSQLESSDGSDFSSEEDLENYNYKPNSSPYCLRRSNRKSQAYERLSDFNLSKKKRSRSEDLLKPTKKRKRVRILSSSSSMS